MEKSSEQIGIPVLSGAMEIVSPGSSLLLQLMSAVVSTRTEFFLSSVVRKVIRQNVADEEKIVLFISEVNERPGCAGIFLDYAEATSRTSSTRVIHVLAHIYAQQHIRGREPDEFTRTICSSLRRMTDLQLELFGVLSDLDFIRGITEETINEEGKAEHIPTLTSEGKKPYPVVFLWKHVVAEIIKKLPELSPEDVYVGASSLIRRDILAPDYFVGRYNGTNLPYGVSTNAVRLREYFLQVCEEEATRSPIRGERAKG
jgi:hypothetical protein